MNLIKSKATLALRSLAILFAVIGLLVPETASQSADSLEEELSSLKLKLDTWRTRYRFLCNQYREVAANCSAAVFNCSQCPDGWFQVNDQCFFISRGIRSDWVTSKKNCTENGGHLAILTTEEQHEAIEKESRRIGGFYTDFWIGLTDAENEGEWKWVDNSTLKTPFWNKLRSEPDDNKSGGEEGEDCAVVDSHSQSWYDVPCNFAYLHICQMDAVPPQ
ncbi:C-type lectin domain family 4 member E [Channa argus]|uniref:C-type lectin domain family 4 member E n=1 Tax=Channa argus TaxID=215402 RepID=A0A6G1PP57_CHAAH|nr:C-type lectin domain family 4 member E [Channa argus]KAK2910075.1 hypothetical protein Q8A73_007790 [Channa argus]